MDVVISWSGRQSRAVADALYVWLPKVLPTLRPWMSTQDINKGKRWREELQNVLAAAKECIVCVTPENIDSPWVYWETGAIGLTQGHPICPLLIGITPDDIKDGPLEQYQCTFDREDDVLLLVGSLNQRLDVPENSMALRGLFATYWSELHAAFKKASEIGIPTKVLQLINGLGAAKQKFRKRWETDKQAEKWDPMKQLVNETAEAIVKLTSSGVDTRSALHVDELREKVRQITNVTNRAVCEDRGDEIFEHFEKTIRALRADYDTR